MVKLHFDHNASVTARFLNENHVVLEVSRQYVSVIAKFEKTGFVQNRKHFTEILLLIQKMKFKLSTEKKNRFTAILWMFSWISALFINQVSENTLYISVLFRKRENMDSQGVIYIFVSVCPVYNKTPCILCHMSTNR